jgi:hypothetical protein
MIYADPVFIFVIGNDIILILYNVVREKFCSDYYKFNFILIGFRARSKTVRRNVNDRDIGIFIRTKYSRYTGT